MLNRFAISKRLLTSFLFLALIGAAIGAVGAWGTWRMDQRAQAMYQDDLSGLKLAARAEASAAYSAQALEQAILITNADARSTLVDQARQSYKDAIANLQKAAPLFESSDQGKGLATLAASMLEQYGKDFATVADAIAARSAAPAPAAASGGAAPVAPITISDDFSNVLSTAETTLHAMVEWKVSNSAADAAATSQVFRTSAWIIGALTAAGVVFAISLGVMLTRSITRPLEMSIRVADAVSKGDLTCEVVAEGNDELAHLQRSLDSMVSGLRKVVSSVRAGVDSVATASDQIASGNSDLSARTEQQASSLEQTAASMEQLSSTVKQNTDSARQANQLAAAASDVAGRGGKAVGQVVETMVEIEASSRKIAEIIGVIDGIAFQTNILALNAAVEAARAGEQGRGFAVVASEVRTLAQRSAAAAKEIKGLIDDSVGKVNDGSALVHKAGATMGEIVASVQRVTDIMAEISAASQEQSAGIEQVNQTVVQMDETTQQNAALVEEATAAARAMEEQAGQLSEAVSIFVVDEAEVVAAPRVTAPAPRAAAPAAPAPAAPPARRTAGGRPMATELADGDWQEF